MGLVEDTIAKVESVALNLDRPTFSKTSTSRDWRTRGTNLEKALRIHEEQPETITIENPAQEWFEIPFTDIGLPAREILFPDLQQVKQPLTKTDLEGIWNAPLDKPTYVKTKYRPELSLLGERPTGPKDIEVRPNFLGWTVGQIIPSVKALMPDYLSIGEDLTAEGNPDEDIWHTAYKKTTGQETTETTPANPANWPDMFKDWLNLDFNLGDIPKWLLIAGGVILAILLLKDGKK